MLVNDFRVVRDSSIGKNESVSNIVSRNVSPINTIFNSSAGFYEPKETSRGAVLVVRATPLSY